MADKCSCPWCGKKVEEGYKSLFNNSPTCKDHGINPNDPNSPFMVRLKKVLKCG
jgi:hypothetical protein